MPMTVEAPNADDNEREAWLNVCEVKLFNAWASSDEVFNELLQSKNFNYGLHG